MKRGHPNHRLVKIHRNYTIHEIASILGVHRNTVRAWIGAGLPTIEGWPVLMLGADIIIFLQNRRQKKRRSCAPGQMYCFRCRTPEFPVGGPLEVSIVNDKVANMAGLCPSCGGLMRRCVRRSELGQIDRIVAVDSSQGLPHINEMCEPSPDSDFRRSQTR
jgi:hypothetical protein